MRARCVLWLGVSTRQYCTASDPFTSRDLGTINIFDFLIWMILAKDLVDRSCLCIWPRRRSMYGQQGDLPLDDSEIHHSGV